jgi:hypothetical protein
MTIEPGLPARLAKVALANVATEYPYHLVHLARSDADLQPPRGLYPAFWGSYDWHSSVHMHWTLVRSLRLAPAHAQAAAARAHLDTRLTHGAIAAELDYFQTSGRASFERPYGWGWLLKLAAELAALARHDPQAVRWGAALAPLAELLAQRLVVYLARADYPVRAGTHGNSAFALLLALDYAGAAGDVALQSAIATRGRAWFGADRDYPARYEPSGDDFLSPGLTEAALMHALLDPADFADWWADFAPGGAWLPWLEPARVADPRDPKTVHLHGLNLARVWCWRRLLPALGESVRVRLAPAIEEHLAASLASATRGDYVGTHWLASFALLAVADTLD